MNSDLPRISVVTPSFNQAPFLETTILSVLGQRYPKLEYFVMDGGSTDGSVEIIRRHAPALAGWVSAADGGQAAALNSALARATGDILCWINSDDFLLPGTLHQVAALLGPARAQPALVYGACLFFDNDGARAKVGRPVEHDPALLRTMAYVIQPSAFWTRALWEKTGTLDAALHFAFDWDWFIRASAHAPFQRCGHLLSAYRQHAAHKSGTGGERRKEEIMAVVRRHGTPADVASFEYAQKVSGALARRAKLAGDLAPWGRRAAQTAAWLATPELWQAPAGIDPERLERARRMLF